MAENSSDLVEPDRRQHPPPSYDAPGPHLIGTATARLAVIGRPVLRVLIASLAAASGPLLTWGGWSARLP